MKTNEELNKFYQEFYNKNQKVKDSGGFDPNEPRDPDGKWTEGGGKENTPESNASSATESKKYTIKIAEEWGMGQGPNATGKRRKVKGFYVVSPSGRRVRAYEINSSKSEESQRKSAQEWANKMTEAMERGEKWAMQ